MGTLEGEVMVYACFEGNRQEWCQTFNLKFYTQDKETADRWVSANPEARWHDSFKLQTQEKQC
jgi:hypothetical protein